MRALSVPAAGYAALNEEKQMKHLESFYDYVAMFYGCTDDAVYPLRFTMHEIKQASQQHFLRVGNDFHGDTIDREAVRDIILEERKSDGK